jgi:hypothetical protein
VTSLTGLFERERNFAEVSERVESRSTNSTPSRLLKTEPEILGKLEEVRTSQTIDPNAAIP